MCLKDQIPTGKSGIGESCLEAHQSEEARRGRSKGASGKWQLGGKRSGLDLERLRREKLGGDEEMPKWRNERTCKLGGRFPLKGLASKHFQRYDLTSRAQNQ